MTYVQHGYFVLPQLFTAKEIQQLNDLVLNVYQQWIEQHFQDIDFAQQINMHSLTHPQYFKQQPELRIKFFNLIARPALVSKIQAVFGDKLYFHNTQLFFNPRDSQKPNYWHRDLQYSAIPDHVQQQFHTDLLSLHVRIALIDETGIELIPQSHLCWDTPLERQVRFGMDGHQQHEDLPNSQLITLKQGDVVVFNAQMIHRGRYDFNTQRLALDLCIGKPHALIQNFMDVQVQPYRDELAQLKHGEWYKQAAHHLNLIL